MTSVKSEGNKSTELLMIKLFRRLGISGWRRRSSIVGKPDFVFPKLKVAVFVDGCFWHGCPEHYKKPSTNKKYWSDKVEGNRRRDQETDDCLVAAGWTVLRAWEHEDPVDVAGQVEAAIESLRRSPP